MFMSRIVLQRLSDGRLPPHAFSEGTYAAHKLIWSFFPGKPKGTPCPLHRFEAKPTPHFYVVSEDKPCDASGHWEIKSQEYDPKLASGNRLEFTVHVNPVVTRRDEQGRQKRHDVVMDAKMAMRRRATETGLEGTAVPPSAGAETGVHPTTGVDMLRQVAVTNWLRNRCAKHGFDFADADIRVDGDMPTRIYGRKHSTPVQITTVDIHGRLTVTDSTAFRKILFEGLGPAKGFGCGLMLVRRAGM